MNHRKALTFMILVEAAAMIAYTGAWILPTLFASVAVVLSLTGGGWKSFYRKRENLGGLLLAFPFLAEMAFAPVLSTQGFFAFSVAASIGRYALAMQVYLLVVRPPGLRVDGDSFSAARQSVSWQQPEGVPGEPLTLPRFLPIPGIVAMASAGNLFTDQTWDLVFFGASGLFTVFAALFLTAQAREHGAGAGIDTLEKRGETNQTAMNLSQFPMGKGSRSRFRVQAATLGLAIVLTAAAAVPVSFNRNRIDSILYDLAGGLSKSAGFGDIASLGDMPSWTSSLVEGWPVLRVKSKKSPGYLRARVYSTFISSQWRSDNPRRLPLVGPSPRPGWAGEPIAPDSEFYDLADSAAEADTAPVAMEVYSSTGGVRRNFFTPRGTVAVEARVASIRYGSDIPPIPDGTIGPGPYRIFISSNNQRSVQRPMPVEQDKISRYETGDRDPLLQVPRRIDPLVHALAAELLGTLAGPSEKIAGVEKYFHKNYKYKIGIKVPKGRDPITWFLLEKPEAHCEYFAAGAALLLRLSGVRCRYVTGFVCDEKNDLGDYWVSRNRDAHAWVEAQVPGKGWVTVEATPPDGRPGADGPTGWLSGLLDIGMHWFILVYSMVTGGGILALLAMMVEGVGGALSGMTAWLAGGAAGWAVTALVLAWVSHRILRRLRTRGAARRAVPPVAEDPELAMLAVAVKAMDAAVSAAGVGRDPAWTPMEFSSRLAAAADSGWLRDTAAWYADFSEARFSPPPRRHAGEVGARAFELAARANELAGRANRTRRSTQIVIKSPEISSLGIFDFLRSF